MANSPTRLAETSFEWASVKFYLMGNGSVGEGDTSRTSNWAMAEMALGLRNLSIALRETYQKLEEMEKLMKQQQAGSSFR
jgi:hypothetical protein